MYQKLSSNDLYYELWKARYQFKETKDVKLLQKCADIVEELNQREGPRER